jgi:hypothetical protein
MPRQAGVKEIVRENQGLGGKRDDSAANRHGRGPGGALRLTHAPETTLLRREQHDREPGKQGAGG